MDGFINGLTDASLPDGRTVDGIILNFYSKFATFFLTVNDMDSGFNISF